MALGLALLGACRIYGPTPVDCRITCAADGSCPLDTTCREGFCRTADGTGRCECREGETRACGETLGQCLAGVQTCVGHEWGGCVGARVADTETCNGLDDDCDGFVDESVPLPEPCERTLGVCADARKQCVGGAWATCEDSRYGPDFEVLETRCDGLDNDCDGLADTCSERFGSDDVAGPWFLLSTPAGFALVSAETSGVTLGWFNDFSLTGPRWVTAPGTLVAASARGFELQVVLRDDAGLQLSRCDEGGCIAVGPLPVGLGELQLGGEVLVGRVDGGLALWDGTGGPRALGGATWFQLSSGGTALALDGQLLRTSDLSVLRDGGLPELAVLRERPDGGLVALPRAQPPLIAELFDELPASLRTRRLPSPAAVQDLDVLLTEPLIVLGAEPGSGALWLSDGINELRVRPDGGVEHARFATGPGAFHTLAWQVGGRLRTVRRCGP